jgi:hypothetical protein
LFRRSCFYWYSFCFSIHNLTITTLIHCSLQSNLLVSYCRNFSMTLEQIRDSKKKSLLESAIDIVIGFVMYLPINFFILPLFAEQISNYDMFGFLQISVIFTLVALLRKYTIRRWFDKLRSAN